MKKEKTMKLKVTKTWMRVLRNIEKKDDKESLKRKEINWEIASEELNLEGKEIIKNV